MEDSQPTSAHWCYQCSAQTAVEHVVGGAHGNLICANCGGGFIEAIESAQALIYVRRAVRRHERSRQRHFRTHLVALRRLEATISEANFNSPAFHQEVRRLVHLVDLFPLQSRFSRLHDASSSDVTEVAHDVDVISSNTAHPEHVLDADGLPLNPHIVPSELEAYGELVSRHQLDGLRALGFEGNELFGHVNTSSIESRHADSGLGESECLNSVELSNNTSVQEEFGENAESHEDEGEEGLLHLHDNIGEDDEASDSDLEEGVLELSDWDSLGEDDEDEWEEVEDDNDGTHEHDTLNDDVPARVSVGHGNEGSQSSSPSEGNLPNARIPRDILRRLHAISRNLQSFNAEIDLETLNLDAYVGNPGDYVDAHGFEELLQQLIDSDNTRRGPPPAAKSSIEGLPTVVVQQVHVENGSALCAICKDLVEFNEPAKQLPCLHLYHSECILPWLVVRNSCPVCRYELPTDDPDYEDQRKHENMQQLARQHEVANSDSSSVLHEAGGEEMGRGGNLEGESIDTEANVLLLDASKGEVGDDSEVRGCSRVGRSGNGHARERGSLLDIVAGPLFSVVGLVVVSCLGNLLRGSSAQRRRVNNQVVRAREMQSGRSWWTTFFG